VLAQTIWITLLTAATIAALFMFGCATEALSKRRLRHRHLTKS
jgi:hypothetical protein